MTETEGGARYVDGLATYVRPRPDGVRVVLVHGAMDRSASFVKAVRRRPDLDVIRYDRRGYGRSTGSLATSMDDQAADLLTVIDGRPAIVIGHSIGGVVALAAATKDPSVIRAVGAFESPMPWASWWPSGSAGGQAVRDAEVDGPEAAAEAFMRRMVGDERWERLPPSTRAARRAEGPALLVDLRSARDHTPPYDLDRLGAIPVHAGHGTESDAHHQEAARRLAALAGTTPFVIHGSGHGAHHTHPAEFASFIDVVVDAAARAGT